MIGVVFRVVYITIISVNIQHIKTNNTDRLSVLVKLCSSSRLRRPVDPYAALASVAAGCAVCSNRCRWLSLVSVYWPTHWHSSLADAY